MTASIDSAAVDPCPGAESQRDLTECADRHARDADHRLESLLKDLRTAVDSTRLPGLDSAQATWIAYRRLECSWEASEYEGGTMAPMAGDFCWAKATEARIRELRPSFCEGGAPDCDEARKYDPTTAARTP